MANFFIAVALLVEPDVEGCGRINTTDRTGTECISSTSGSTKPFGTLVCFLKNLTSMSPSLCVCVCLPLLFLGMEVRHER